MKTQFQSKGYPGKISRPRVESKIFESEKVLSIGVPWGNNLALEKLNEMVTQNFLHLKDDDLTVTGASVLKTQDKNLHFLKTLIQKTNIEIQNQYNKDFYTTACEALIMLMTDYQLAWIQIGQPAVVLLRERQIQILQSSRDLSADYSMPAPLPAQLLGVNPDVNFNCQNFLSQTGDILVFFTGSSLIPLISSLKKYKEGNLTDALFNNVVKENPDSAFWLGCLFID